MFSSFFIHSNELLKTLIQSFYIALSQNSIRERQRKGARVIYYPRGAPGKVQNFFLEKVSQCQKLSHSAENTLFLYH